MRFATSPDWTRRPSPRGARGPGRWGGVPMGWHVGCLSHAAVHEQETPDRRLFFDGVRAGGRATTVTSAERSRLNPQIHSLWIATERLPLIQGIWPNAQGKPQVSVPQGVRRDWPR